MNCIWHTCGKEIKGKSNKFCSVSCRNKYYVQRNRIQTKLKAIQHKGGKCENCGYNKCVDALEFHHSDPSQKEFNLSKKGHTISWDRALSEVNKCQLLCANCHRELHYEEKNTHYIIEDVMKSLQSGE